MPSRFDAARFVSGCVPVVWGVLAASCGATQLGATDVDLIRARDQAAQGGAVFSQECANCHGQRGEGLAGAPAILGPGALPEYPRDTSGSGTTTTMTDPQQLQIQLQTRPAGAAIRDPLRNAQDLHDFTKVHMPKSRASALKEDDYWAVVTFLLAVQGSQVPAGGINATSARSIPIPR
jgi:cytochrome c